MEREEAELRALQQGEASLRAANKRITTMAEELRKAELVRDRLEGLARLMGSYPEGHDMRTRLEALHVERALEGVNDDIRTMTDALMYPGGTIHRGVCEERSGTSRPEEVPRDTARTSPEMAGDLAALNADAPPRLTIPEIPPPPPSLENSHAAVEAR